MQSPRINLPSISYYAVFAASHSLASARFWRFLSFRRWLAAVLLRAWSRLRAGGTTGGAPCSGHVFDNHLHYFFLSALRAPVFTVSVCCSFRKSIFLNARCARARG
jgi:hypothetical protein